MDPVTSAHQNQHLHEMIKSQQAHIENLTRMLDIALRKIQETPKIVQVTPKKNKPPTNHQSSDESSDDSDSEDERRSSRKKKSDKKQTRGNIRFVKPPSLFF